MAVKKFSISSSLMQGLEDTITAAEQNAGELRFEVLRLDKVDLDEDNPRDMKLSIQDLLHGIKKDDEFCERKNKEKEDLISLAASIASDGLINPIFVYQTGNRYKLVAGERRTLASWIAKKETIQAKISDRKPSPSRVAILQWAENVERKDLTLLERRDNLIKIKSSLEKKGEDVFNTKKIIETLGCSTAQAYRYLALINADDELVRLMENKLITSLKDCDKIASAKSKESRAQIIDVLTGKVDLSKTFKKTNKPTKKKVGRQASKVNFGATKDINVAYELINILLQDKRLKRLNKEVSEENLDFSSLSGLFEKIVKTLSSKEK